MDIEPFALERWFAKHEHGADIMLAESGIRSLPADHFDRDPGPLGYVIPTNGDPALRERVGDRHGRGPDEVLFACGAQEANFLTFWSLLDPDDHAVVVTPTYQSLASVPEAICPVTRMDLEPPDWRLDLDAVADAIGPETALIVLANPNNPTGRYHDRETIEALLSLAADADARLLCDEVYRLLAEDPLPPVASLADHGISTGGITKVYGLAGARFGWLCGPKPVVESAWRWKDYTTISPPPVGQHIAKQALGPQEDAILAANRTLARRNRALTAAFLDDHGLDWHEPVGVNGFVTLPDGVDDSRAFCRQLVDEESVVLAPGACFGVEGYFRIGFGLPTDELEEGLQRVGVFIERDG